jgi:hypothetical protein
MIKGVRVEKYFRADAVNYNHWVVLAADLSVDKSKRRLFIKFVETLFGRIGERWHYQRIDFGRFILKFQNELDAVIFLMKFSRK